MKKNLRKKATTCVVCFESHYLPQKDALILMREIIGQSTALGKSALGRTPALAESGIVDLAVHRAKRHAKSEGELEEFAVYLEGVLKEADKLPGDDGQQPRARAELVHDAQRLFFYKTASESAWLEVVPGKGRRNERMLKIVGGTTLPHDWDHDRAEYLARILVKNFRNLSGMSEEGTFYCDADVMEEAPASPKKKRRHRGKKRHKKAVA